MLETVSYFIQDTVPDSKKKQFINPILLSQTI